MRLLSCAILFAGSVLSAQSRPAQWHISAQPTLSVGTVDGSGPDVFGTVSAAVRQASGAIVVVDGTTLKFFDPFGRFARHSGRAGAGPGEFRSVKTAHLCGGDSVFVYDPSLMKLSVFTPAGDHAEDIDMRSWVAAPPYDFWCNRRGVLVFMHRSTSPPGGIGPRRPEVSVSLAAVDSLGARLGSFPASERYFDGSNDFPRPLGMVTSIAVGNQTVFIGSGESYAVQVFSLRGESLASLREPKPNVRIEKHHVQKYVDEQLTLRRGLPNIRSLEQMYTTIDYPKTFPAYAGILVDDGDNLWVEDYPVPGSTHRRWAIYSRSGQRLGTLVLPSALELQQVGGNYVFGIWRDESGAMFVRTYALSRN